MTRKEEQKKWEEVDETLNRWESKYDHLTTTKMFKNLNEYFWNPEDEPC